MINKIAIVGISGSGKSTLSRKIAEKTNLPLFHMDQLYWKANWQAVPEPEYLRTHELLVGQSEWIIEGYIDGKMANRLKNADLVIYLDYSGLRCAWHLIMRRLKYHRKSRPELPKEAIERLKPSFFWMVLKGGERADIEEAISKGTPASLKRFHSPNQLKEFLKVLVEKSNTQPVRIPKIIEDVGFNFHWDSKKVWALDEPVQTMDISELIWHFDVPFWEMEDIDDYNLTPKEVIREPDRHSAHYKKVQEADLKYPIDIMENKGRWLILDGLHRLVKAQMQGLKTVRVRKIPRSRIPEILK